MNTSLFQHKSAQAGLPTTALGKLVAEIEREYATKPGGFVSPAAAGFAMSMESIDGTQYQELNTAQLGMNTALESCLRATGLTDSMKQFQRDSAIIAGMMAGNMKGTLTETTMPAVQAQQNLIVIRPNGGDMFEKRVALEAFDEKETRNATMYSIAYNMNAARQDEFGETFFPTVVVTPDQNGLMMSIRLLQVMKEVRAGIDGDVNDFGFRNIINAVIDPTILQNDLIKIIPIVRAESQHHFVDPALVAPRDLEIDNGITISTAPLAMNKKFSLIGLSQTEATLETGLMDHTDSVDTSVVLQNLYLKAGADVVRFGTARFPYAPFHYAVTGDYRRMDCMFSTADLRIGVDSKTAGGSALTDLKPIVDNKLSVRLSVNVNGNINLQTAETKLFASSVEVYEILNQDGEKLSLTTGIGKTVADLFATATIFGYDLEAQRTNLNRRQRGQMLNQNFQYQLYQVPLRSPMTITRPTNVGELNDATDLAALITATHIRTSNAAVGELISAAAFLRETYNAKDTAENQAATLGVARHLVKAYYEYRKVDVSKDIDSLTSNDRYSDAQATIINKLRDIVYNMHRDSNYQAAANALSGGIAQKTRVLIGTDPIIARYLFTQGDTRTLGEGFEHVVVTTLDKRMKGKIFVTFGVADQADGVPNPMHFGNMAWKPEMTYIMPVYRNGANIKEVTVMPAYLHIVNLPVLCEMDIEGLSAVMNNKVAINVNNTPTAP
jgi:hypothetical protein